jgi:hypothetical protein
MKENVYPVEAIEVKHMRSWNKKLNTHQAKPFFVPEDREKLCDGFVSETC